MTAAAAPVRGQPGQPYTPDEDTIIRGLYRTMPVSEIAAGLGRTRGSVYGRARAMGLARPPRHRTLPAPPPVTLGVVWRVWRLLDLLDDGEAWPTGELTDALDCDHEAVYLALALVKGLGYPVTQGGDGRWCYGKEADHA